MTLELSLGRGRSWVYCCSSFSGAPEVAPSDSMSSHASGGGDKAPGGTRHLVKESESGMQVPGNPAGGANTESVVEKVSGLSLHGVVEGNHMSRVRRQGSDISGPDLRSSASGAVHEG